MQYNRLRYVARWIQDQLLVSESRRKSLRDRRFIYQSVLKLLFALVAVAILVAIGYAVLLFGSGGNEMPRDKRLAEAAPDALHGVLPESKLAGISLNRAVADFRSRTCLANDYSNEELSSVSVIIIFCNEPFETLMRSVHSVLNRSRRDILKEIILVDDGSDAEHIVVGGNNAVVDQINQLPGKVKLVRNPERLGIVGARMRGINEASGEVFVILDSHIEVQSGWLEPLVHPISLNPQTVVMPHIDGIDLRTKEPKQGGVGCTLGIIWKVMEHAFEPDSRYSPRDRLLPDSGSLKNYVSSPTMAGGLFAANKDWFLSIGGYDSGMKGWGAENVEFSFRLWMCGGRLLCTSCSRVYHMFGGGKYYSVPRGSVVTNRMRTIAIWMDEFADLAWRVLDRPNFSEIGDISEMMKFKQENKCQNFQWYLDNVWPESEVHKLPDDVPYAGHIRALNTKTCIGSIGFGKTQIEPTLCGDKRRSESLLYWKREGRITSETNDELCFKNDLSSNWCANLEATGWDIIEVPDMEKDNGEVVIRMKKRQPDREECLSLADNSLVMEACDISNTKV